MLPYVSHVVPPMYIHNFVKEIVTTNGIASQTNKFILHFASSPLGETTFKCNILSNISSVTVFLIAASAEPYYEAMMIHDDAHVSETDWIIVVLN